MTPPTTDQTALLWRLWRWMSPISGILLWLCIAFWVLALGLFTLMHVLILPRIDAIRPSMERQVGEVLGLQVHIGTLEAHTSGIWPTLQLKDLQATNAQQALVFSVDEASLGLSWASVLRRSLDHLDVNGLTIGARLDDQGQMWVGGIRMGGSEQTALADTFFKIHSFSIINTHIDWVDEWHHAPAKRIDGLTLGIQNGLLSHHFTLDLVDLTGHGAPLSVRAQMRQPLLSLHPGEWSQWSGQIYAQVQDVELMGAWKYLANSLAPSTLSGAGWLRFWSEVNRGSLTSQVLDVSLSHLKNLALPPHAGLELDTLQGRFRSKPWKNGREWETESLLVQALGQPQAWDLSHLRLRLSDTAHPWSLGAQGELNVPQASLDNLTHISEKFAPEHALTQMLKALNLKGELRDFSASWTSSTPSPESRGGLDHWLDGAKQFLAPAPPTARTAPLPSASKPPSELTNPFSAITQFRLQGHLQGFSKEDRPSNKLLGQTTSPLKLAINSNASATASALTAANPWVASIPNIKGADINFDVSERQGQAHVTINDGFAEALGVLEDPRIEMKKFSADVAWENGANQLHVHVNNGLLDNSDGSARFKLDWQRARHNSADPHKAQDLGHLDLDAQVLRLEAKSLYKYLPQVINAPVRQYFKEALTQGFASQASIKIHGPLSALPYKNPKEGELSIRATLNHLGVNYFPKNPPSSTADASSAARSPSSALSSSGGDWPSLVEAQGEFNLTGPNLSITKASAFMATEERLLWPHIEIHLPDLLSPTLEVLAETKSALPDLLSVLNHSPVSSLLSDSLQKSSARGIAELKLKLSLPLMQMERSKVQGALNLINNDFQLTPDTPVLTRARGTIAFTDSAMVLQNVQVQALGGDARVEGGFNSGSPSTSTSTGPNPTSPDALQIRVNGQMTAQGLSQACELGWISHLGALSQGSTPYSATITSRETSGVEVSFNSTLQGLAVLAPEPLRKSAASTLNLSLESSPFKFTANNSTRSLERVSLVLDDLLMMRLYLDNTAAPTRIYKGALTLQSTPASSAINPSVWLKGISPPTRASPQGWDLDVQASTLSLDDWQNAWSRVNRNSSGHASCDNSPQGSPREPSRLNSAKELDWGAEALPARMNLHAQTLTLQGRSFHQTHLSTTRQTEHWLAQIESQELRGNLDLVLPSDPSKRGLNAHLSYLNITPSAPMSSDPLLSSNTSLLSWLSLSVDELELKGQPLGKLQFNTHSSVDAQGQTVWQFAPLTLSNADATLNASGHWGPHPSEPKLPAQTALNLDLDIANAGNVLDRFGMTGVLKNGKGHLKGQVSWGGSLINPNFDQLSGQMNLDLERGQFLKTDPGASRLLGVLNLQALPRRLTLDFRDLFGEGFAFDNIRGDVSVARGNASTQNLVMKGVSAAVMLDGQANIAQETQDVRVVVIPEINAGTASLLYSTINPVVGLTSFLAQYVLRQPLIKANTRTFHISGSWQDPQVTKLDPPQETHP